MFSNQIIPKKYTKLVFEGCGTGYASIVGGLKTLEEKGILDNIDDIAATSGGVLPAFLCGLGIAPDKIMDILKQMNYKVLAKKTRLAQIPLFGPPLSVVLHYGFQTTDTIIDFVKKILSDHNFPPEMTFDDLAQLKKAKPKLKNLYFTAVNNSTVNGELTIFSHTNPKTKHVQIAEAFAAAVAIPIAYEPVKILIDGKYCNFGDGGTKNMFPYDCFPREEWKTCLGFKLDEYWQIYNSPHHKPRLVDVYFWHLLNDNDATYSTYPNVIQIFDVDMDRFDFPSLLTQLALFISGRLATAAKLNEFSEHKSEEYDFKEIDARTNQYKKRMETSIFPLHADSLKLKKVYQEIEEWDDEIQGCCVHYNALLDELNEHWIFSMDCVFNKIRYDLFQLLQERAAKAAFLPNTPPNVITDVVLIYLKNNSLKKAYEFLKRLENNSVTTKKLLKIDHLRIVKTIQKSWANEKEELIELVRSFRERRLMDHPGGYEAYLVAEFGKMLQTKNYRKAAEILKKIKDTIPQFIEQVYEVTHQQFRENAEYGKVLQVIVDNMKHSELKLCM